MNSWAWAYQASMAVNTLYLGYGIAFALLNLEAKVRKYLRLNLGTLTLSYNQLKGEYHVKRKSFFINFIT
jgi:hypothetical protein